MLAADPVISEFLSRNDGGIRDANGRSSDWIEIYNSGPNHVDIGGYYLTDDFTDPFKWQFPANAVVISKGTLLVWADGLDVAGNAFHTNFKLKKGGEDVAAYLASVVPAE